MLPATIHDITAQRREPIFSTVANITLWYIWKARCTHVLSAKPSTFTDTLRIIWSELTHTLQSQWDASQGPSRATEQRRFEFLRIWGHTSVFCGLPALCWCSVVAVCSARVVHLTLLSPISRPTSQNDDRANVSLQHRKYPVKPNANLESTLAVTFYVQYLQWLLPCPVPNFHAFDVLCLLSHGRCCINKLAIAFIQLYCPFKGPSPRPAPRKEEATPARPIQDCDILAFSLLGGSGSLLFLFVAACTCPTFFQILMFGMPHFMLKKWLTLSKAQLMKEAMQYADDNVHLGEKAYTSPEGGEALDMISKLEKILGVLRCHARDSSLK